MIKAILFDMDGVLLDTEALMLKAGIEGLKHFGVNAVPEDFAPFVGAGETKFLGGPAAKYGVKFVDEMKTVTYAIYDELLLKNPQVVFEGVKDVVSSIQKKYPTAVCSAADRVKVLSNLRAINIKEDAFTALITGSDVKRQKPFPDIYLEGAKKCSALPSECIAIDDSPNGIKAANAAGCISVGLATTFPAKKLKEEASPMYIIDSIKEFAQLIEKIAAQYDN